MNPLLDALFYEPQKAYLGSADLGKLSHFVSSLPERINFYRRLRNEEVVLMQSVADSLGQQFPQESEARLKRSLQNGILVLRCAAMGMLMDDTAFSTRRLSAWFPGIVEGHGTQAIDRALYPLLKQQFSGRFTPEQMALLSPGIDAAIALLSVSAEEAEATDETLVSLF